jgi:hypothetical protein
MSFWDGTTWVPDATHAPSHATSVVRRAVQAATEAGLIALLTFGLIAGTAFAAKGGGGCTPAAPRVAIENTYAWSSWGSYGMAGQTLLFQVSVSNYDDGCRAATFVVHVTAPDGFIVSLPTDTVSLRAGRTTYLSAWVTSPDGAVNGDYAIQASAARAGGTGESAASGDSFTSYYMVYSSDEAAPDLFWVSPGDGAGVEARSFNIAATARDNRAVRKVDLVLDGVLVSTVDCDGIAFSCQLVYTWSTSPGDHVATFRARDWMGNVSEHTSTFTVE